MPHLPRIYLFSALILTLALTGCKVVSEEPVSGDNTIQNSNIMRSIAELASASDSPTQTPTQDTTPTDDLPFPTPVPKNSTELENTPASVPTATLVEILPTETPTATLTAFPTDTPALSPTIASTSVIEIGGTSAITAEATSEPLSMSKVGTSKAVSTYVYYLNPNPPLYLPNFARSEGCEWQGVGGQVFDENGDEVKDLIVTVGWTINGISGTNSGVTGNSSAYGPGGYEVDISYTPFTSQGNVWIQLSDPDGNLLSRITHLDTYDDCTKNLIVANFQYWGQNQVYLPYLIKQP